MTLLAFIIAVLLIGAAVLFIYAGFVLGKGSLNKTEKGKVYEEVKVFRFRSRKDGKWNYYSHPGLESEEKRKRFFVDENGNFIEITQTE